MNLNAGYWAAQAANAPYTTGKVFVVASNNQSNFANIDNIYTYDSEWVRRRHSDFNSAVSTCVSGRWDVIVLASDYTADISSSDVVTAENKWVSVYRAGRNIYWKQEEYKAASWLPQSSDKNLFTVKGRIKLLTIVWEVTTDIQSQTNNTKLIAKTSNGNTDLCSTLDIDGNSSGTIYTITGTLSDSLQSLNWWAIQYTSNPVIVNDGTIDLSCDASSTWEIKWKVEYEPISPWARVIAA